MTNKAKRRTYNIFTSPKEISDIANMALQHLPPLGFEIKYSYQRVGQGEFDSELIGAVANGPAHTITVNLDWYEKTDAQDLHYIIWHETRHLYQWSQIEKLNYHLSVVDDVDVIKMWEYNMRNYIYNTKETEYAHMKQEMEIDAYAFAVYMLFHYFRKPDGQVCIGLPPMTEDEIMKRVQKSIVADFQIFRRII